MFGTCPAACASEMAVPYASRPEEREGKRAEVLALDKGSSLGVVASRTQGFVGPGLKV